MSDQFVAEIRLFAGNFAPAGWALCNGQILYISQNTALFSLLGTTYGGDGKSTFGLPNFMDRVPVGAGQGPGLSDYAFGQSGGSESVTLLQNEMPSHQHIVMGDNTVGTQDALGGGIWANTPGINAYDAGAPTVAMSSSAMSVTGGGQPHNNMQPYLGLTYIIAMQGIFPQRP